MAKYSIPDLTSEELSLLGSGAYTEEEILRRREQAAKRRAAREQEAKAYTPPPVEEAPLQEALQENEGGFGSYLANKASAATDTMQAGLQRLGADLFGERDPRNWNPIPIQLEADRQSNRAEALSKEREAQSYLDTVEGPFDKWAVQTAGDVAGSWPSAVPLVAAGAGGLISGTVGRIGGGAVGALAPTAMKWLTQYEEGRDHLPAGEAAWRATETVPSEYIGEALGALGPVKGNYLTRVGLRGLWEAGGEAGTEVLDIGYDIAKREMGPEEFRDAYAAMAPKDFEEAASRIGRSASAGLLMGGGIGTLTEIGTGEQKKPETDPEQTPFLAGQEMSNELERLVKEAKSKTPDMSKDIDMANSFVSLNLDDITKMPQFTMDLKGHKFQDNNMVQPIPTEVQATPQNRVDELQRQAKEEQLRNLGMPRLPDSVWEGGRQIEPVMPGPFQTQNAPLIPLPETPSNNVAADLSKLSTVTLQILGEMGAGSSRSINQLPPADVAILEAAGLVEDHENDDGTISRVVYPDAVAQERNRRAALPREATSQEDINRAVENRARNYERIADEKEEAGYPEEAAELRAKAAAIRSKIQPVNANVAAVKPQGSVATLLPDPLTGQAPAIPEVTFNNEFRPPSQLQGREVLGLRNYNEKTGTGTGPIGPANAPTEAPVQPEGMPEVPSQYQQSYTLPPFKQGYDLKLGKQTKQAETKASPAAEIKSLLDQLNRKPKLASSADTDMAILERQEDTDRFEQVIRKGNIQDAHTLADTLKGMLKSDRAKSMVNAFLSAGFLKNVQVRIADTEADLAMLETDNARALYQPAKDGAPAFILLAPSKAGPTRHGMSPDLVYHEIGHAVTYEMVEAARTGVETTPEIQSLYEQLDMLRQDVAANIDKMATNEAERQAIQNATSDVHEMISYTLTNQNFNKAASRFRVKGITVRQWIKNILSKLATKFGVSVKDANNMMDVLFDRALTAVQETAKYDPAKFEMRGRVDKETGTVDKRLVNKATGKPLASEITTKPPVLYSQLQNLINSSGGAGNATLDKWYSWLDTMVSNKRVKLEEAEAFKRYLEREKELKQGSFVTTRAMKEHANEFNASIGIFSQGPVRITEKSKTPITASLKNRLLAFINGDEPNIENIPEVVEAVNQVDVKYAPELNEILLENERTRNTQAKSLIPLKEHFSRYSRWVVGTTRDNAAANAVRHTTAPFDEDIAQETIELFKEIVRNSYSENYTMSDKSTKLLSDWLRDKEQHIRAIWKREALLTRITGEKETAITSALKTTGLYDTMEDHEVGPVIDTFLFIIKEQGNQSTAMYEEDYTLPGGKDYGMIGLQDKGATRSPTAGKERIHTGKSNVIGWARFKTRGNGLAIEEIQSDWNQELNSPKGALNTKLAQEEASLKTTQKHIRDVEASIRSQRFSSDWNEEHLRDLENWANHADKLEQSIAKTKQKLKDAAPPLSKEWVVSVLKPVIAEAVQRGLSYVSFTKGEVQAERYDMPNSNIPAQYDNWFKQEINNYVKKFGSKVVDGADPKAHNWDGGEVAKRFWVFEITPEMQETVLTKGQPRFVKRDDTGKVVDEVAERRNRLQPDTTEVAEAEEITMESESQPSPDSAYDSKLKLYGNKASAGNVPVSQVASKLDKGNVRPIDIGVMDELLRSGSSAEVPLFDQETGREIGATTTGEGETVQGLMGVEAREAANDSAEGPKPAAVKRPFESLPPDRSPAGWFVNVMRGLFKPTAIEGKTMGKETMVLVEAMNEYKGQQFYRAQQALNVLADSPDQKNMLLALEGDEAALKKLSADDAQAVSTIVNTIDMLQRAGVVHELASLKNPTEKDIAVAKKVVASILGDEKYRHRAYAKDIQKRGISTKWVADLLRNKDEKGSLWQNAKAHLIANELTIPSDFKSMGLPTLERMYAHWTGLNPEGKSKSEIIASLEKFRNKSGPEIDAKAEELVKMLLDLTPTPGPGISRLYAGNKQDLTIVTPRSKIDEPIRKLWGEVEDPLAKIVVTVTKLIEFNARHRFLMNLYETGVKDGWIAEADDPKADPSLSVTLEGREFGPLDGMRVTPNVKSILDSVLKLEKDMEFGMQNNVFQGLGKKVGKKAVRFWERGLISPIKALMLTTNPKVWITNLLSGPGVLMANGNFTGAGGLTVIKNAWGLANITKHKKWNPFTDKVISQGWMDSALFGELTNEQLSDYASAVADSVFTEDTRRNKFRKLSIAAKDKATGSKDVFRNMFALMDMGYKLMNGVNEANRLRAIHPDWSDEKVMAVASDRVKMTNYTRGRAIPVAKWADKKGLQFFATYMSEIGRTLGYNTMIGVSDVIAGSRDGNPKQIAHGMSRVIGVGLATMYYDQLLSFAVSGAGMLMGSALSILGEDDDEDRNEKARDIIGALPEDWRNQLLVPIAVTKDGKLQMQAADRFDFHGQWNSIFRAAAKVANGKEDWKFLANEVQNLFFMHSLVRNMLNPNPGRLQKIAPEAYETAYKFLTQTLPLSDSTANRIINTAMTADVPVIRTGLLPTINNMGKPASERQDVNWLGFNPIEYDPKLELVRGADRYNGSLSANRNELAKLIANTGMALDKPGLEKFYNSALDEEISAFSELNAKVKGARAMGYNNSQIASILASQNVRRDYIPYVMHGKFVPRPFGDRYLQSAFIDTQFSDATPERKKALSNRLIQARAYLDQLRMEYMQNDRLN